MLRPSSFFRPILAEGARCGKLLDRRYLPLGPNRSPQMSLKKQLAEYRAAWYQRVPAERQAIMQRHIDQLRSGVIARTMLTVGDRAPAIVLENAAGATVDVGTLLNKGPVIVTFYRGGWCPYCNLE